MTYRKLPLFSVVLLSAAAFWACKEDPNPRTMADQAAPAKVESAKAEAPSKLKAKVRKALGDVDLQRNSEGDWNKLRIGQNVVENDHIRTAVESEAVCALKDGSSLWIDELSDVVLSVDIFDSLKKQVAVNIREGKVFFDVQKQNRGTTIEFRTATAVAAIRGTAGFVGNVGGQMVASLKEGSVDVTGSNGVTENMVKDQTVIVSKTGVVKKIALKSSGTHALSKAIDSLVSKAGEAADVSTMEKQLEAFDKTFAARRAAFEKKLKFQAAPLAEKTYFPNVTLQARVTPGVVVTVLGESDTVGENGIYQRTMEWEEDAYGTKRFLATCSEGDVEIPCYMWVTEYEKPAAEPAAEATDDAAAAEATSDAGTDKVKTEKKAAEKPEPQKQEAKAEEPKKEEPKKEEAKNLKVNVRVAGGKTERKHLDLPANEYKTNLRFSLAGITEADVSEISSITVTRKGATVKTFSGAELSGLNYEVPVEINLNTIANFDIKVALKNGKTASAKKTYEVYCLRNNHMGKARNFVRYKNEEEEYEAAVQQGILKQE